MPVETSSVESPDSEVIGFRASFEGRGPLDELLREGARRMLQSAIEAEVDDFIVGHAPFQVINIELAPDTLRLIDPESGILSHANHFADPNVLDVSEPPNPHRHHSAFRQKRMETLCLISWYSRLFLKLEPSISLALTLNSLILFFVKG